MYKSKLLLASILIVSMVSSLSKADKLGPYNILMLDNGTFKYMNQQDAEKACPSNTHLPTAREEAIESQSRGAKGILEISQVKPNEVPNGYYLVSVINPDGKLDEFYFNQSGFKNSDPFFGNWFWTSSVYSKSPLVGFYLNGWWGYVGNCSRRTEIMVRCIANN